MTQVEARPADDRSRRAGRSLAARDGRGSTTSDLSWVLTHQSLAAAGLRLRGRRAAALVDVDRKLPVWLSRRRCSELDDRRSGPAWPAPSCVQRRSRRSGRSRARRGVVLAAGGFEHNQQMREQLPAAADQHRSGAPRPGVNTGRGDPRRDGARAPRRALMDGALVVLVGAGSGERRAAACDHGQVAIPAAASSTARRRIATNRRTTWATSSSSIASIPRENPQWPSWLVFDARARHRYFSGPSRRGTCRTARFR